MKTFTTEDMRKEFKIGMIVGEFIMGVTAIIVILLSYFLQSL